MYNRNVFPDMKVGFGTYPSETDHRDDTDKHGCFRCHGDKDKGGLKLDSRAAALAGGDSKTPALVPGKLWIAPRWASWLAPEPRSCETGYANVR